MERQNVAFLEESREFDTNRTALPLEVGPEVARV